VTGDGPELERQKAERVISRPSAPRRPHATVAPEYPSHSADQPPSRVRHAPIRNGADDEHCRSVEVWQVGRKLLLAAESKARRQRSPRSVALKRLDACS
jgi:hypothetical protein